ncbi:flagellar biosynthetic protein FliQ [Yoonia sp. SS1-5]|uniref:Flagellar biosynthetic protein FliQ n=1 Tax=Yoonia rhodophyticola TaxID=3137370 RepID=A0AAN0M8Y0_9RHOB
MAEGTFAHYLIAFMMNVVLLAGLPLAVATVSGLIVSIIQAVTQIQDQTLSQTMKIVAITAMLLSFGGSLVAPLLSSTRELFSSFGNLGF